MIKPGWKRGRETLAGRGGGRLETNRDVEIKVWIWGPGSGPSRANSKFCFKKNEKKKSCNFQGSPQTALTEQNAIASLGLGGHGS